MSTLDDIDLGVGVKAVEVIAAADSVCALTDQGGVRCWGSTQDKLGR